MAREEKTIDKEYKDLELEALNDVYRELGELIGIDKAMKIYNNYKGLQVNFPTRLYEKEYVVKQALKEHKKGNDIRKIAVEYHYSERWIKEMIAQSIKEEDDNNETKSISK